jgi:capsular exopolysaccharide synthesis family protein
MALADDPRADIFRVLRTKVLRQLRDNGWHSFAVTSATVGAGKTVVSINLAIALALEGNQPVLLVDADLRRPMLPDYLGVRNRYGLIDILTGTAELDEVEIASPFESLRILPGRDVGLTSSELISSPRMEALVADVKNRYGSGIVVFDIPPLFVADDFLLFLPYIDGALLVVEDGQNTPEELQGALQVLEETNLLGMVLNKATQPMGTLYRYDSQSAYRTARRPEA